jgi:predicted esterase
MHPPVDTQWPEEGVPGFLELSVPGITGEPDFNYFVQLPPEYDPQRKYPCIVTLNGSGTTPEKQIDWWAGSFNEEKRARYGQASRHGYIVLAPVWSSEKQTHYKFSAREHAAVLYTLRDLCRRFSVDTDRIFLTGHSMGGDAAWDIGLAHPDLWAGVIPIVATADKYITRYWQNAHYVPFYFVGGERDGNRTELNKSDYNRYLRYANFDVIVTQFQGRGHEDFHDEIQNLFTWMNRQTRDFFPKEFECTSMRPWDNFFWWAEMDDFPERTMVLPLEWSAKSAEAITEGKIQEGNSIYLNPGGRKATVWLAPEMVNFDERVRINIQGKSRTTQIEPSARILLDDVRTRGDRQHPFWAKYENQ